MQHSSEKIASDLRKLLKGDVFADILHRVAFSCDASIYQIVPVCVVAPCDTEDVVAVVKYAGQKNIPITARGAGSGVAGESLSSGIVLDMPRYMNKIRGFDEEKKTVVCQPGVVLDEINDYLAKYGVKIGPDPSSSNRAVIGGCVANNSTGAHCLQYGFIADHVESIEAVLDDGSIADLVNNYVPELEDNQGIGPVARGCLSVLENKEKIIEKALPETSRNRSGYNIAGICHDAKIDLARLMAGSEGTLAVFTKITLKTVPIPKEKGLLQFEFDSFEKMASAIPVIIDCGAAACEVMDKSLIDMARDAYPEYKDILPAHAKVSLLVEHVGDTYTQVKEKIEKTDSAVAALAKGRMIVFDTQQQQLLWQSRKDAVPLIARKKGKKHPIPFIEDASVENNKLSEYISGLKQIAEKYDFSMSYYGHAGDGLLHVRPFLDLSDNTDIEKMTSIAEDVFNLVWSLGGSISAEHAEGLVRTAFIKRQFGQEYYELLRQIKNIFDPAGLFNPGKIISDDPDIMIKNLKAQFRFLPERLKTELHFDENELQFEIDHCSGCGVCLSTSKNLRMCPVYRALGEELGSSRAKANIIRFWATGQLQENDFESAEFNKFLSLCINCKACSIQCPSGVDISKIVTAARAQLAKKRGLKLTEKLLSQNRYIAEIASFFSSIYNFIMQVTFFRWLIEKISGINRLINIPSFESDTFIKKGRLFLQSQKAIDDPTDKVAYFVDTYINYNDHRLGECVLKVLLHNNIKVFIPDQMPVPLPSIVYGDVKPAKNQLLYNVKQLANAVKDGYKIICSEPSAALSLKQELRFFVDSEDVKLVSENTYELMNYLLQLFKEDKLISAENSVTDDFVYHCPCHLLAVNNQKASIELLKNLCGLKVQDLNAGCCGMAGTFGMQKKNYELSIKISQKLKEALKSNQNKIVLTECSACKMQIEHISNKSVFHPIQVIKNAYKI